MYRLNYFTELFFPDQRPLQDDSSQNAIQPTCSLLTNLLWTPFSQGTLNSAEPEKLPPELLLLIFSLLSTKQALAPLRAVSKTWKNWVDTAPEAAKIPYAELNYSSLIEEKIKSYPINIGLYGASCFAMLSNGMAVTAEDNVLYLHDLENFKKKCFFSTPVLERKALTGHTANITAVHELKNGIVISASKDTTLRVWDLKKQECIQILKGHTDTVTSMAKFADPRYIASASEDKTIRFWNLITGEYEHTLKTNSHRINSIVDLTATSARIVTENSLWHEDFETGNFVHYGFGNSIHLSSNDQLILNLGQTFTVIKISSLLAAKPTDFNSFDSLIAATQNKLEYIECPHYGGFGHMQVTPFGQLIFTTRRIPERMMKTMYLTKESSGNEIHVLGVYDLNLKKFILSHDLNSKCVPNLQLLDDQRIAICDHNELRILPFEINHP